MNLKNAVLHYCCETDLTDVSRVIDKLVIVGRNELERLKIGDYSFENVERFEIQKCDRLKELIIGGGANNKNSCFSKVESFELSSLIDLIQLIRSSSVNNIHYRREIILFSNFIEFDWFD